MWNWNFFNLVWKIHYSDQKFLKFKLKFEISDTKLYVPVVTLWTQDKEKLSQQLKTGFKRTIDWNKYQLKPKIYTQNRYLNYLIDPRCYNWWKKRFWASKKHMRT